MQRMTLTVALPEAHDPQEVADIEAILHATQLKIHLWSDVAVACLHCNMTREQGCGQ